MAIPWIIFVIPLRSAPLNQASIKQFPCNFQNYSSFLRGSARPESLQIAWLKRTKDRRFAQKNKRRNLHSIHETGQVQEGKGIKYV